MEAANLEQIGLTEGETKVYLSLLEIGTTSTGPLVKHSGISSSKVYPILERLSKKGLVGHIIRAGTKYYQAAEPRRILDYVANREEELREQRETISRMIPQLEMLQHMQKHKRTAEIFEGQRGVTNLFLNILTELKKGESYNVIGAGYGFEENTGLRAFFTKYHAERARRGIKVKMLANYSVKKTIVATTKLQSEVRYLPEDLITNVQITFTKDKTSIILWSKNPLAFLIHSTEASTGFRAYFDSLWKRAKDS